MPAFLLINTELLRQDVAFGTRQISARFGVVGVGAKIVVVAELTIKFVKVSGSNLLEGCDLCGVASDGPLILDRRAVYEEEPVLQVIADEGRVVMVDFVDDRVILSVVYYVSLFERKHNTVESHQTRITETEINVMGTHTLRNGCGDATDAPTFVADVVVGVRRPELTRSCSV